MDFNEIIITLLCVTRFHVRSAMILAIRKRVRDTRIG